MKHYPLYVKVAETLGWTEIEQTNDFTWIGTPPDWFTARGEYHNVDDPDSIYGFKSIIPWYDQSGTEGWALIGPIIEKWEINLKYSGGFWHAYREGLTKAGKTPLQAACELIVQAPKHWFT